MRKLIEEIFSPLGEIRRVIFKELIRQVPEGFLVVVLLALVTLLVAAVLELTQWVLREGTRGRNSVSYIVVPLLLRILGIGALVSSCVAVLSEMIRRQPP